MKDCPTPHYWFNIIREASYKLKCVSINVCISDYIEVLVRYGIVIAKIVKLQTVYDFKINFAESRFFRSLVLHTCQTNPRKQY